MLTRKNLIIAGLFLAASALSACGNDKVIPQGERVPVLSPIAAIRPDLSGKAANIKIPVSAKNTSWTQNDMNAQHLTQNLKTDATFAKQWETDFGKGNAKREFLISRPVVNGQSIYTMDAAGRLSAFDLSNGKRLWELELKAKNENIRDSALKGVGLAFADNTLYAVTGYGNIYAVDAGKGSILWEKSLQLPLRIAPTVANRKLFIQSADNKFFALNTQNGDELWKYDISLENTTLVGGAPAAYSDTYDVVLAGFSNGELQAFNATIGTPLWSDILISNRQAYSSTFLTTIKAAPVIENGVVYAAGNANILTAIDIRSGTRLWEKEIGSIHTPILAGNTLYAVSNTNDLVAIDKESGNIVWATPIELGKKPSEVTIHTPLMLAGRIVVTLSNGLIHSYMPQTGKLINTVDLDEDINAAPVVANGYILFVTTDAELIAYK